MAPGESFAASRSVRVLDPHNVPPSAPQPETLIGSAIHRNDRNLNALLGIEDRLRNQRDRIFGSRPEKEPGLKEARNLPSGTINELLDRVDTVGAVLERVNALVNELSAV